MLPGLVLVTLVVAAVGVGRGSRLMSILLAVTSVAWLLVNGPMEGAVLVSLSYSHGLTAADLAGFVGLGLAGWGLLRGRNERGAAAQADDSLPSRRP